MTEFGEDEAAILAELARNLIAMRRVGKWLAWVGALSLGLMAGLYHLVAIWRGVSGHPPAMTGGD